jgi:hypothetical protein
VVAGPTVTRPWFTLVGEGSPLWGPAAADAGVESVLAASAESSGFAKITRSIVDGTIATATVTPD